MVITYRDEAGWPEYTANFSDWDFKNAPPDSGHGLRFQSRRPDFSN